jgi:hypothetical protein
MPGHIKGMNATALLEKHAAQKALGQLSGMDRLKIQILKDIMESPRTTPRAKKEATAGLAQWEKRATERGHGSLEAWLAVR